MLSSKHHVSSFRPVLLTDSAKSEMEGSRANGRGLFAVNGVGLLAVVLSVETGLSVVRPPNRNVAPKTQILYLGPETGLQRAAPSSTHLS